MSGYVEDGVFGYMATLYWFLQRGHPNLGLLPREAVLGLISMATDKTDERLVERLTAELVARELTERWEGDSRCS